MTASPDPIACVTRHHLVRARNETTTYVYYWCPICEIVLKDLGSDQSFRGHPIREATKVMLVREDFDI